MKKGVTPIFAAIIIIGLVLALSGLYFKWGTTLFQTTLSSSEESEIAFTSVSDISLDIKNRCIYNDKIMVNLNNYKTEISSFMGKVSDKQGSSTLSSSEEKLMPLSEKPYWFKFSGIPKNLKEIEVFPMVGFKDKVRTCPPVLSSLLDIQGCEPLQGTEPEGPAPIGYAVIKGFLYNSFKFTLELDDESVFENGKSLKLTPPGKNRCLCNFSSKNIIEVDPAKEYMLSAWVKSNGSYNAGIESTAIGLKYYDSEKQFLGKNFITTTGYIQPPIEWSFYSGNVVPENYGDVKYVQLYLVGCSSEPGFTPPCSTETVFFDGIQFFESIS